MEFTLLLLITFVNSHGLLYTPIPRGYDLVTTNIDSLRNPNTDGLCRGLTQKDSVSELILVEGESFEIELSIGKSAGHIGYCNVELYDYSDNLMFTLASDVDGCGVLANPESCESPDDDLLDSCLKVMSIDVPNLSGFTEGYLRWYWKALHILPTVEEFENCADVKVTFFPSDIPEPTTSEPEPTTTTTSEPEPECEWEGHCLGASCETENDCSDVLVCNDNKCSDTSEPEPTTTSEPEPEPTTTSEPAPECEWEGHCLGASCETENDCSDVLVCKDNKCSDKPKMCCKKNIA